MNKDDFFPTTKSGEADMLAFEELYIRQYFKVCRDAIKEIDPKEMYLDCSFGGGMGGDAIRISSNYCDVVTRNIYTYNLAELALPKGSKDCPMIIGKYHFTPQDQCTFGITMVPVASTKNQVNCTIEFMKSILHNPNVAGTVWFEWTDLPTCGRYDKVDSGIGITDIADTPHYDLVEALRRISESMYKERLNSKSLYHKKAPQDNRNWN